jgi:hypothetical protein
MEIPREKRDICPFAYPSACFYNEKVVPPAYSFQDRDKMGVRNPMYAKTNG